MLNVDTSSTRPRNMVNFGFGLRLRSVGEFGEPLQISTGFASWQRYSSSGHQLNFAALNRGRHLYSAVRPSRWALAHIVVELLFLFLAVEVLQGKMCQNSLPLGGGMSIGAKISGEVVIRLPIY